MVSRVTLRRKSRAATAAELAVEEPVKPEEEEVAASEAPTGGQEDEGMQEEREEPVASTSTSNNAKGNFVLVMDNGQLALVPSGKAHTYRSLPRRGQKVEDDSGTSTPLLKNKKRPKSQQRVTEVSSSPRVRVKDLKKGKGRPSKRRSKSQMLEFEFEEEEEEQEDDDEEEEEEEEEEEAEEEPVETPSEEVDEADDENLIPLPFEMNVWIQGKDYLLKNEELVLDSDEEGDKKVDEKGVLLGGREYNFKTFTSSYRADQGLQYALSIDAARGAGYRDSLYFFRKNPLLIKLSCTDKEKVMLIEQGRLSGQLRTRNVTMLAVRNVYKLHGAKVVKDGKFIVDDYYEKEARETGKIMDEQQAQVAAEEESTPVPKPIERRRDTDRDRDRTKRRPDAYTFSTTDIQGNPIYTTFGDGGSSPFERSKGWNARRVNLQRADIDEENWMMEMARSVRGMNHEILMSRNERLKAFGRPYEGLEGPGKDGDQSLLDASNENGEKKDNSQGLPIGFFEPMTNMPHYSSSTQPTWSSLERVNERPMLGAVGNSSGGSIGNGRAILGNAKVGSQGWGLASIDQTVVLPSLPVKSVIVPAGASAEEKEEQQP